MYSLDAQKCFDTIWHDGLFYKLKGVLPHDDVYWLFLYRWYSCINAVRVSSDYSQVFPISRGTRQGSVLSPTLFNVFIDDLLQKLHKMNTGVRLGCQYFGSFAYANVTVISATVPGLQRMIDVCTQYAEEWRMLFNPVKSKCMTMGRNEFVVEPSWYLKGSLVENVSFC